jgi:DMSO/TMAO reductase YedYZ molybdopterin-dependent catalytic subunit
MAQQNDEVTGSPLDRRRFLAKTAIGVGGLSSLSMGSASKSAHAQAGEPSAGSGIPGLVMREREPSNLEFPFSSLDGPIVPTHRFFVRSHFAIPNIDVAQWRLEIDGAVEKPVSLSYEEFKKLPSKTLAATIECAGNSRGFLVPKASGVLWEFGGIGNAEWTGVSLSDVLERAGIKEGAVEVVLEGADTGSINSDPKSPGEVHFERSLPLDKAKRPEVILAYKMNGKELTPEHGFPVRAVVAGWYGMASVKWLRRLTVTTTPFLGFWQTSQYSYWKRVDGRPSLVPVTEMQVKSSIARPSLHEQVPSGTAYRVHGAAWAGEADIAKVEVSVDGGSTWSPARLLGDSVPYCWRLWEYDWKTPQKPGTYRLMSRATDSRGRTQATKHDHDRRAYMISHVIPVDVSVV